MTTLILGSQPVLDDWLAQRRALGQDGHDEVWEGMYHVAPYEHARNGFTAMRLGVAVEPRARAAGLWSSGPFNLGERNNFRVPDLGFHRTRDFSLFMPTAAIVVELLSPDDETYEKLPFYAAHLVDEVWIVDAVGRTIEIRERTAVGWDHSDRSGLLAYNAAEIVAQLDWPG